MTNARAKKYLESLTKSRMPLYEYIKFVFAVDADQYEVVSGLRINVIEETLHKILGFALDSADALDKLGGILTNNSTMHLLGVISDAAVTMGNDKFVCNVKLKLPSLLNKGQLIAETAAVASVPLPFSLLVTGGLAFTAYSLDKITDAVVKWQANDYPCLFYLDSSGAPRFVFNVNGVPLDLPINAGILSVREQGPEQVAAYVKRVNTNIALLSATIETYARIMESSFGLKASSRDAIELAYNMFGWCL